MNKEGKVLGSCSKVYNSREGFEQFCEDVEDLKAHYGLKDVLIGMNRQGITGGSLLTLQRAWL